MKRLILLSIITIAFASCKKCYQCKTTTNITGQSQSVTTSEFCGTKKQVENHERENSATSKTNSGGFTITTTIKTLCN